MWGPSGGFWGPMGCMGYQWWYLEFHGMDGVPMGDFGVPWGVRGPMMGVGSQGGIWGPMMGVQGPSGGIWGSHGVYRVP